MLPFLLLLAIVTLTACALRGWTLHSRAVASLADPVAAWPSRPTPEAAAEQNAPPKRQSRLGRWLAIAGYDSPDAVGIFVIGSIAAITIGVTLAWFSTAIVAGVQRSVREIPGGIGDSIATTVGSAPWAIAVELGVMPYLIVRRARRRRVRAIEQDLPIVLEMLATLAQAGLGLDAALSRVVTVQPPTRPLTMAFRAFQFDVLAGVPRVLALRQLAARLDVTGVTVFVAAIIQAEQVGASIAETLRHQADDMRVRRRERALVLSQSLPVKLVLPLVACFLPGIFLSTLGPVLYQMIQVADSVLRPAGR